MSETNRRDFLKLGAAASAFLVGCGGDDKTRRVNVELEETIVGEVTETGNDYSPTTGAERIRIPSACWQCVARDGIVGFVEDGRLEHIEGNPELLRTNGKLCSRGQGGVGQAYDPDRLLFPMRRSGGERGDGQWERITWDEALTDLTDMLSPLLATPEQFAFHYGRMKASSSKFIKSYFLKAFGTGSVGNHTSICESAKWTAQELTWGGHYDVNDVMNSGFILNFGCNVNECHTNHLAFSQRVVKARADNGTRMVTFDVRLSNTAATSDEWVPITPGTDLAVVLAMVYVILDDGPPAAGATFIDDWTTTTVAELTDMVRNPANYVPAEIRADQPAGGYTPEWAAGISGVPAAKIRELAREYAGASPGATVISYRGAVMHYNGVMCERAIIMLEAICGNIETEGGRVHAVGAGWAYHDTYPTPSGDTSKLSIWDGEGFAFPTHHVNHRVLSMIRDGANGRPDVYMMYCYNPTYANGDCQGEIEVLKDEAMIPHLVSIDVGYGESTSLADLVLPDATYLERWDWEDMVSMNFIPEWYIRQPLIEPLGEARDFKDVCVDLAQRLGLPAGSTPPSAEQFVEAACNDTEEVAAQGGFDYMREHGAYYDPDATPKYNSHLDTVTLPGDEIEVTETLDLGTGDTKDITFYLDADYEDPPEDYRTSSKAYKHYLGQLVNGTVYRGFKPDKVNKSGLLELRSPLLDVVGFAALPTWMPIPEHQDMEAGELILTTYKLANQTHSRTQNCKYLTEIAHSNPAWINPTTASDLGISDGDRVRITNTGKTGSTGRRSITVPVKVTEEIVEGVIAISHSLGHWTYGRYASGEASPLRGEDEPAELETGDPDIDRIWWTDFGVRPNWIIPNAGDPIGGTLRFMDTVVTVASA